MNTNDAINNLRRFNKKIDRSTNIVLVSVLSSVLLIPLHLISKDLVTAIIPIYIPLMLISIIVSLFRAASLSGQFKELYKQTFVTSVLRESFSNAMYDWTRGFSQNDVKQFGLCKFGNRFSSEDYLSASYNDVKFEMADVTIQYDSGTGEHSHTTTYFKGRMLAFEFPKNNITSVQLHSKDFKYAPKNPFGYDMKGISTESTSFNSKFLVTSANEHDAFYVLTPQLMESIQRIYAKYQNIEMHFAGNNLYVGLDGCSDTFDFPAGKYIDYEAEQERIKNDIQDIKDIIDAFTKTN